MIGLHRARTVLADDHALVRAGIRQLLEQTGLVEIVAEASDGSEVLDLVLRHHAELAVLDLSMPRLGGLDLLPLLAQRVPHIKAVVLSMHANAEYVREALARGALGFLPKDAPPAELKVALQRVLRGETYVAPNLVPALLNLKKGGGSPVESLPPRQRQLLGLIGQGHSSREIAQLLGIGIKTVETHRRRLMQTLALRHNTDLVRFAAQHQPRQTHGS